MTNTSWVQVKVSHKHWPNCTVSRWATHSLNASLLRKHQGLESLPLPGNCATSGGRESYSSSTSSGCSPEALWVCKMQMLSLTSSNSITVFSKHQLQDTGGKWMFLLFQGYDELPKNLHTNSSIFLDVITGRKLWEATVLVTSRLGQMNSSKVCSPIEILGFTEKDIQSFLESNIHNDPFLLASTSLVTPRSIA